MGRKLPVYVGIVTCLIVFLEYFFKISAITQASKSLQDWIVVISACAMGLGATGLCLRHYEIVSRRQKNWGLSICVFIGMTLFPITAIIGGGRTSKPFLFVFDSFYAPVGATFFSILIFYTASAAYRTFRLKSTQAGVLLFSAILLMLGRVPAGDAIWSGFPKIADWIMMVPVNAANRGILIGTAVGVSAAGIRYMVGLERSNIEG